VVRSIFEIDVPLLHGAGIEVIAFDIDNTLGPMGCREVDDDTLRYLKELGNEFALCLATNSRRDVTGIADPIGAKVVQPVDGVPRKPHVSFFKAIAFTMATPPRQTAMVGDKLMHDTTPAATYGMHTVLVNPLGEDLFLEKVALRRPREDWHLRRLGLARPA